MQSARDISSECGLHRTATLRRKAPALYPVQTLRRRLFNRPARFRRPSILYAPICSLVGQFVALFIPQQQLFCPMPHCFRKQANLYCSTRFIRSTRLFAPGNFADPAPFKSRKRGRGFNRCIYPSEAVRQRSVRPYDTADTVGKLSTREDLPPAIPATGLIGFIESSNNFSADFLRHLNFRNRRGKRHCIPFRPSKTQQNVISLKMNALTF